MLCNGVPREIDGKVSTKVPVFGFGRICHNMSRWRDGLGIGLWRWGFVFVRGYRWHDGWRRRRGPCDTKLSTLEIGLRKAAGRLGGKKGREL